MNQETPSLGYVNFCYKLNKNCGMLPKTFALQFVCCHVVEDVKEN